MTGDGTEVLATVYRMAALTDDLDWDTLATLFANPVDVDYTSLNGGDAERIIPEALVGQWRENLSRLDATQHLLGSPVVVVDGDRASVTCAVTGTHRRTSSSGGPLWTVGGHYDIVLHRESDWRIASLRLRVAWATGNQAIMQP